MSPTRDVVDDLRMVASCIGNGLREDRPIVITAGEARTIVERIEKAEAAIDEQQGRVATHRGMLGRIIAIAREADHG